MSTDADLISMLPPAPEPNVSAEIVEELRAVSASDSIKMSPAFPVAPRSDTDLIAPKVSRFIDDAFIVIVPALPEPTEVKLMVLVEIAPPLVIDNSPAF